MVARLRLTLSEAQASELIAVRDHSPKAYLRERASALLKVAAGQAVCQVAEHGLLRRREPETVSDWVYAYQRGGVEGLQIQPGRGRKPKFFPPGVERSGEAVD